MTTCPFSHIDIDQVVVDVLCCLTVIMDMSGVGTGTAGLPSGSIPCLCPAAVARAKTTSTAQGKDCIIFFMYF